MAWLVYPTIGALIGWFTNRLALRLLFRPHRPIGVGPFRLQGLLPRRRQEITATVAEVVETELFSRQDLLEGLAGPAARSQVSAAMAKAVVRALQDRLLVPLPGGMLVLMERFARAEADRFIRESMPDLLTELLTNVEVASLVAARLDALDLTELEQLVRRLAARELRHIEWLGAAIGAVVGLLQAILVLKFGITFNI